MIIFSLFVIFFGNSLLGGSTESAFFLYGIILVLCSIALYKDFKLRKKIQKKQIL